MLTKLVIWFFSIFCFITIPVHSQCLEDQKSLLLQLKSSLRFHQNSSGKLANWTQNTDCCQWNGVTCDNFGHVVGLNLQKESIFGGLDNSSSLFGLKFLEELNLARNRFGSTQIPTSFGLLINLKYMDLSNTGFVGQVPLEFSRLTRLEKLDISNDYSFNIRIEGPDLFALFHNLSGLTELYLDGVNILANGSEWGQAISSSLPNLQVLSLSGCLLSGPIDSSLQTLQHLSIINLAWNNLSSPVPDFFAKFSNLKVLILSGANLYGTFPDIIIQQVQTLETLDLSFNPQLNGSLLGFPQNLSLRHLWLGSTSFSGNLPESIENLRELRSIDISSCYFSGPIPSSLAKLGQLVQLYFSENNFRGSIPSFQGFKNLISIDLSYNALTGPVPSIYFEGLSNLVYIALDGNSFNGSIPSSLFSCPSLQSIGISNNQFSGTIQLESFNRLQNLSWLDLSHNILSVNASISDSILSIFPQLQRLALASCKLQQFPPLMNLSLEVLDLSDNQISGVIPSWIWNMTRVSYLNLSCNYLVGFLPKFVIPDFSMLDLHSNQLRGEVQVPSKGTWYVDYSSNKFSSSIPHEIGSGIGSANFFSVSHNKLSGPIPPSICDGNFLEVLDLSNNRFTGNIPQCLIDKGSGTLSVLNLRNNQLAGRITGTFPKSCALMTLDLNANYLEGQVPKSLANCKNVEVLNLGINNLDGNFPCFLANLSELIVLVLRSNKLHGTIHCGGIHADMWPKLQIIDLALNNFSGTLPEKFFSLRKAMMNEGNLQKDLNQLRFETDLGTYYEDSVTVINQGRKMELVTTVLALSTIIDFSNNSFNGKIPDTIGELKYLFVLNFSHNALSNSIPSSLGNMTQLESLDLSWNKLRGHIPVALASLTFLSFLNLSYNQLDGMIPTGTQFQTFPESSFEGNDGLCGAPLIISCDEIEPTPFPLDGGNSYSDEDEIKWLCITATLGYAVGFGVIVWPLLFSKRWRQSYYKPFDRVIIERILHHREQHRRR